MSEDEARHYRESGYLVRRAVFSPGEVAALREAVDAVAERVATNARRKGGGPEITIPDGHRLQFTSQSAVQWEWAAGSQEIRLIEPCDHLDPAIRELFDDARLVEPMRDAVGREAIAPFTSKLNLKRPREGSEFPWHQDFPYWFVRVGEDARDVVTAILFLDDADAGNGALRVLPGSHHAGPAPRDPDDPTKSLADPARLDVEREVVVDVRAGDVLFFGALLVHRSTANTSDRPRRALLPSFQPAGRVHWKDSPYHPEKIDELP